MSPSFDEHRFRELWLGGQEVQHVRSRAQSILRKSGSAPLNGLSELLARILPADPQALRRLAEVLRISKENLERLRTGSVDPLLLSPDVLADLGQVTTLDLDAFTELLRQDHSRFARKNLIAVSRGGHGISLEDTLIEVTIAWNRSRSDVAEDL